MTAIDMPLPGVGRATDDAAGTVHVSLCTLCEAHCGIHVTVTDGKVSRIEGNRDDVFSKGYICPKATAMGALHHINVIAGDVVERPHLVLAVLEAAFLVRGERNVQRRRHRAAKVGRGGEREQLHARSHG